MAGDQEASAHLIAETNRDRLIVQRDAMERMETKGTILLGFTVTAFQIVLAHHSYAHAWRGAALISYAAAFAVGVFTIVPYTHDYPPHPRSLYDKYTDKTPTEIAYALAIIRADAFVNNAKRAKVRVYVWWATLGLLAAALALSAMAAYQS